MFFSTSINMIKDTKAILTPNETSNKADYFDPVYAAKYWYIVIIILLFIMNNNIIIIKIYQYFAAYAGSK